MQISCVLSIILPSNQTYNPHKLCNNKKGDDFQNYIHLLLFLFESFFATYIFKMHSTVYGTYIKICYLVVFSRFCAEF